MKSKSTPKHLVEQNATPYVRQDMSTVSRLSRPISAAAFHGMAREVLKDIEIEKGLKEKRMTLKASRYLQFHFNRYLKDILGEAAKTARVDGERQISVEDVKVAISTTRFS